MISIVSYELEMISPRTVANTEGIGRGNVGAISLNNFCIAIDSSMYVSTGDVFRSRLEEHFKVSVKYLIITHYHADHTFGMKSFNDIVSISNIHVSENLQNLDIIERYKGYIIELEKDDPLGKDIEFLLPNLLFTESIIINDENLSVEVNHVGVILLVLVLYFSLKRKYFLRETLFLKTGFHTLEISRAIPKNGLLR